MQSEHLNPLNDSRVACGACGTDGVVRTGDAHVQGDFTSRIVGDRSRVMVVGPVGRIVIVRFDGVDFVFGFHVSVLGHANVNTDFGLVDVRPVDAAALNGFGGCPYANGSGTGSTSHIASALVFRRFKLANASQSVADVTNIVFANSTLASEQRFPKHLEVVAVGRCQTNASNHDALIIRQLASSICETHSTTQKGKYARTQPGTPTNISE